ncbi:MAG: 4-aminobutyrate aminotransferase, partial [Rubritalea sp.]
GLGGTFGGNPLGCAAALAVLDVIEEEQLLDRGIELGNRIKKRLDALASQDEFSCIGDVRGLGAMVAFELVVDRSTQEPATALTAAIMAIALKKGLILIAAGPERNVLRILVPLTAAFELVDEGLDILESAIREAL